MLEFKAIYGFLLSKMGLYHTPLILQVNGFIIYAYVTQHAAFPTYIIGHPAQADNRSGLRLRYGAVFSTAQVLVWDAIEVS